jgi:Flp pilus assembly protein TadG
MATNLLLFLAERRGGVAVLFALALLPLIGAVGAAVDYTRMSELRETVQRVADAAALATAKANGDFSDRKQKGMSFLTGELPRREGVTYDSDVSQVLENGQEAAVRVTVSAVLPTTFTRAIGFGGMPIAVEAQATSGRNERFDVAFVLDTTGSMEGERLSSLKSATTALIDDFVAARRGATDQIQVSGDPLRPIRQRGHGQPQSALARRAERLPDARQPDLQHGAGGRRTGMHERSPASPSGSAPHLLQ